MAVRAVLHLLFLQLMIYLPIQFLLVGCVHAHGVDQVQQEGQPAQGAPPIHPRCLPNTSAKAKQVTHYFIPLIKNYDAFICDKMEGTCIFEKNGVSWLHNYGYPDEPLDDARCKNGYGNNKNCLHPCRALAASMAHHTYGEVIYFKNLVGKKCGNLKRDGFELTHDGYAVVIDTGSPKHFNARGRFDFFWGRCKDQKNGECLEGAVDITSALSTEDYCVMWDPKNPTKNADIKAQFTQIVKKEARQRGDISAADDFDLDK